MEKTTLKLPMLARGLGLICLGFLIGITSSVLAQEEMVLVDQGKTELVLTPELQADYKIIIPIGSSTPQLVAKLDIEKTTNDLIANKIELQDTILEKDYLISKYAQAYDYCRFATGLNR